MKHKPPGVGYKILTKSHPEEAKYLMKLAQEDVNARWKALEELASDGNGATAKPIVPPSPSAN